MVVKGAGTVVFTQEVDALLQDGGLVHLACDARQHGPQLLDEDIELVSALLLRLVTGYSGGLDMRKIIHIVRC